MKTLNKFKMLFLLLLVLNSSCNSQNRNNKDISLLLNECKLSPTKESLKLFFDTFPSSYNELQNTFGYSDEKGAAPYYNNGEEYLVMFFKSSQVVDKEVFIDKLIEISKGGKWDADNVNSFQEKLRNYFFSNDKAFLIILNKKDKAVIKEFWYFFSDEPVFNKENYVKVLSLLETNEIMKQIYIEVVEKVKIDNVH
jgi:hypothetical protein